MAITFQPTWYFGSKSYAHCEWPRLSVWAFQTPSGWGTWEEAASFQGLGSSLSSRRDFTLSHLVTKWHPGGFVSIRSPVCHLRCEEQQCFHFLKKTRFQSRFDAWDRVLRAGVWGWPRGMGWGGSWERGSGWGTHVHPWRIHVNVWQNHYNIVK